MRALIARQLCRGRAGGPALLGSREVSLLLQRCSAEGDSKSAACATMHSVKAPPSAPAACRTVARTPSPRHPSSLPTPPASLQPPLHTQQRSVTSKAGLTSTRGVTSSGSSAWWWAVPVTVGLASIPLSGFNPMHAYNMALQTHPLYTKWATGILGALVGDTVAQAFPVLLTNVRAWKDGRVRDYMPFRFDPVRAGRFMLFSAALATPCAVVWFGFLDQAIVPHAPTSTAAVATKVALDQLCMSPIMTAIFFIFMSVTKGQSLSQAWDVVRAKLVPTMKLNYMLWPLAHIVNFSWVASDQRILYINTVAILWSCILSTMAAAPTTITERASLEVAGQARLQQQEDADTSAKQQ